MKKNRICIAAVVSVVMLTATCGLAGSVTPSVDDGEVMQLRKIMRGLSANMQRVVDGLARDDWQQIESAAADIADHPTPPLSEKMRIMAFMGTDMGKFKGRDNATHDTATELVEAAEKRDSAAVISTFARLQSTCLACHQQFRPAFVEHFYGNK